jgi:hypothetical protein
MDWKEYQKVTADVFEELGCCAEVDKTVQGVRGKHRIDVWVVFNKFGFKIKWIIECKFWNSNVSKEKVLALKSIVDDVGADRGVIISKTGYQSGAIRAADKTNITLTNLEDLKETVKDDLLQSSLHHLESRVTYLKYELNNLYETEKTGPNSLVSKPLPGIDGNAVMRSGGLLSIIEYGFDKIRLANPPYPVSFDDNGNKIIMAPTVDAFVEHVTFLINDVEALLKAQLNNIKLNQEDSSA